MKQNLILEKLKGIEQLIKQVEKPIPFNEACQYLDVSKSYLYKLTYQNKITYFKPNGKKIYFSKADLNTWLFRNKRTSHEEIEQRAIDYAVNSSRGAL